MAIKSPALRSATSSATQPPRNPGLFQSPYTLASTGKTETGRFGAIALVAFPTLVNGKMKSIARGEFIPPEITMEWPLQNRLAMGTSARVRYFVSEGEALDAFPKEAAAAAA